jgi:hypothetical protein
MHQSDYAIFSADMQGQVTSWNLGRQPDFGYAAEKCWDAARRICLPSPTRLTASRSEMQQARARPRR